ncbi:hypothetical protein [Streptomyces sp. CT34]|uniref:hypothetical protein n=1 Tax=Streptomyces sp. CT34 TaxID=1553907 RepID=UPI00068AD849|nr:hypothetical protein [Streptomyces sp. CT34]
MAPTSLRARLARRLPGRRASRPPDDTPNGTPGDSDTPDGTPDDDTPHDPAPHDGTARHATEQHHTPQHDTPHEHPRGNHMAYDIEVAKAIHRVGKRLQVDDKVMLAAFETGIVESGMRNLPYGDQDSLGVFQQRPSQGWGTPEEIMNPEHAAQSFFERAVDSDRNDPGQSAGHLAQSVQRSAYPDKYDQQEDEARKLIAQVEAAGDGGTPPPPPGEGADFTTWGVGVRVRKEAKLSAEVVQTLNAPTPVHVDFQVQGDLVVAEGLSNPYWAHVPALNGFVSNIFIHTPAAFLPGVPLH